MADTPFIPRSLARKPRPLGSDRPKAATAGALPNSVPPPTVTAVPIRTSIKPSEAKKHGALSDADVVDFLHLSLSSYALWIDPDLRRAIEQGDEGFIPLIRALFSTAHFSLAESARPSQASLARAIRGRNDPLLEVRMLVVAPDPNMWDPHAASHSSAGDDGGYEVRRKDWKKTVVESVTLSEENWTERTVYIENLPAGIKTICRISQFISSLTVEQDLPRESIVQNVAFDPIPHQDDQGRYHGFAFVLVRDLDIVEKLITDWPWDFDVAKPTAVMDGHSQNADITAARRCGFRALKQKQWLVLKEEYLEYRQRLVDTLSPSKPSGSGAAATDPEHAIESRTSDQPAPAVLLEAYPHSQPHADVFQDLPSYPHGCLAFIKNIHPETNKTTLKELLSAAFRQNGEAATGEEVDYVDYLKGIDSCHVRLSQPALTTQLRDYFATHRVCQASALDSAGATMSGADGASKSIEVEIIQGRKEELYWAKVPDRVRATALLKIYQMVGGEKPGHDKKRRRKR